jgi:antitoxin ParD1/3/4
VNVSLPDPMKAWVETRVETGHFSNASDYVRDLIRSDQQDQAQREALVQALVTGETSGISSRDIAGIWNDVEVRHGGKD